MGQISIDEIFEKSLYDKVCSEDILTVHKHINCNNGVSEDVVCLENELLINSYIKNKNLFQNRYIYYKFAMYISHIGFITNSKEAVLNAFDTLMLETNKIYNDELLSVNEKLEKFNLIELKNTLKFVECKNNNEFENKNISIIFNSNFQKRKVLQQKLS